MSITLAAPNGQQPVIDDAIMAQMAEQYQDFIEANLKPVINVFQGVGMAWEDIAGAVNTKAIQTKNSAQVINGIRNTRSFLASVTNSAFANVDIANLAYFVKIADAFVSQLEDSVNSGLAEIAELKEPAKLTEADLDPETIIKAVETLSKRFETVQKRAKTAGLTWYNKLARNVEDYVIQPAKKVSLTKYALLGGVTGLIALNYWFHSDHKDTFIQTFAKKFLNRDLNWSFRENLFGWAPHYDAAYNLDTIWHDGGTLIEKVAGSETALKASEAAIKTADIAAHPLSLLGQAEHWIVKQRKGQLPLAEWLVPVALVSYKQELSDFKDFISKHTSRAANFLRGGEYRNKREESALIKTLSDVTFDDIVGKEHAKEIAQKILKYLEDPERFARQNLVPEKGYLLYGPTRTGKSFFAKALAGEIQALMKKMGKPAEEFGFLEITADMITKIGFDRIMAMVAQIAPCVVFIDEIDLLNLQRIGDKNMLGQFLTTLSGITDADPKKQIILLAATNKPENLDFALRQHGRFGKSIFFDLPPLEERAEYIARRLDALALDVQQFDIKKFALETQGCTFEDINAVIKAAFQKSKIVGAVLSQELLEQSFDEEIRNIITKDDKQLTEQEIDIIATNQAALALSFTLLNSADKVAKVTIQPVVEKLKETSIWAEFHDAHSEKQDRLVYGRIFTYKEHDALNLTNASEKMKLAKQYLAGSVAEKLLLGTSNSSYKSWYRKSALNIMQEIAFDGIDPKELPKKRVEELRDKAFQMFQVCEKEVETLLNTNKEALTKLIEALKKHKTLTGSEVEAIIKQ